MPTTPRVATTLSQRGVLGTGADRKEWELTVNELGAAGEDRGTWQRLREALLDLNAAGGPIDAAAICARAEVDPAEFRLLFQDSRELFCSVLEAETMELLRRSWLSFSALEGWANQLRAVAHTMLEFLQEDERRARLMLVDAHRGGERGALIRDQGMQALFAFIDLGREQMDDPEALTRTTAEAIGSSIYVQIRTRIEDRRPDSLSSLLPEMMYYTVLPYLGVEAAEAELENAVPSQAQ
jgi:hypothetical protein